MNKIEYYRSKNVILGTIGEINPLEINAGLVVWARNKPKMAFRGIKQLADQISKSVLQVIIDDTLPQALYERSDKEQQAVNQQYIDFFTRIGCRYVLSSKDCCYSASDFINFSRKISLSKFEELSELIVVLKIFISLSSEENIFVTLLLS
jgi:hypothetical protein